MKRVEIQWEDSFQLDDATWMETEFVREKLREGIKRITSIGHVIAESATMIAVAGSYDPESECCGGVIVIPKSCILRTRAV